MDKPQNDSAANKILQEALGGAAGGMVGATVGTLLTQWARKSRKSVEDAAGAVFRAGRLW